MIRNPILKGFNPDPSICRVGPDYYIATSTFEWYPGVQIHHSRDLVNWRLVTRPLDRAAQLDMRGEPDSCGVWAPCLSHADGRFWLIYTDVKRYDGNFKDAHNYLVTAPEITGPWSDPIYLNSSGFDPSLFHDDDGRKWFVNQQWTPPDRQRRRQAEAHRLRRHPLQEYDPVARKPDRPDHATSSPARPSASSRARTSSSATAGTTSRPPRAAPATTTPSPWPAPATIRGPYELHPATHLITSKDAPDAPLQRAGHGQIVETPDGDFYHTHLCTRPLPGTRRSPARPRDGDPEDASGRDDGWLYLAHGGQVPALEVAAPRGAPEPEPDAPGRIPLRRPRACRRISSGSAPPTPSASSP